MSALDTLRSATGTRKTVTMCLDGALQAEWEQALERLSDLDGDAPDTGSLAMPALTEAVDHMESLREKVRASEVTFVFANDGLPWTEYLQIQALHPPREDNLLDRVRGFNTETFYPELVRRTCLHVVALNSEPEPVPDDVWDSLLGTPDKPGALNMQQVNKLIGAADYVVNGESKVPPSARSLLASQDSGASLAQPSPGTSAPAGSEDGNPPSDTSTSTPTEP